MADRYWAGGAGSWNNSSTAHWSAAVALTLATTSCSGTTLTTTGSPALVVGMTIWATTNASLGTISGGSANTWTVTVGGTYPSQTMTAATVGASVPTASDNVFFGVTSSRIAYSVTIGLTATPATCLNANVSGPAVGNVTILTTNSTAVINVYGSWLNAATGVTFTSTSGASINFLATSTGKTVNTGGVTFSSNTINFNGIGGYWTLGSNWVGNAVGSPNILAGTFDTGGNLMTVNGFASTLTNTNAKVIKLNASTITCTGNAAVNLTATNLVLDAGTSTIDCSVISGATFAGGNNTFYNVIFSGTFIGAHTITGANTFNNLTVVTPALQRDILFGANQTINGTLTLGTTNTAPIRISIGSNIVGTQRTLTVANLATLADVDFRDINAAVTGAPGTATLPWTGTRLGNCLNNSNITFLAGVTKYWNLPAGGNWTDTAWALTDGGAVAVNNFPLAQDSVDIGDTYLNVGATITINTSADIGNLSINRTINNAVLAIGSSDPRFYGNVFVLGPMFFTGSANPTFNFYGQGLASTLGIVQFAGLGGYSLALSNLNIDCPNGSLTLQSAVTVQLTINVGTVTLTSGTLNLDVYYLTAVAFSSSNTNTRTLAFGAYFARLVLLGTSATIFNTLVTTGLTVTGTTPLIQLTTNATTGNRSITMGAAGEANAISVDVLAGSDQVNFATTAGAFKNVNFTGFTGNYGSTNTIYCYGSWNWGGVTTNVDTTGMAFVGTSGPYTITSNAHAFPGSVTFNGVGGTWNCADALSLTTLSFLNGTLNLAAGTTSTVAAFVTTGTTMKFLGSTTPGTQATISDTSGTNTVTYLSIKDSNATGGATWDAYSSATNGNSGNNTGWFLPSVTVPVTGTQVIGYIGTLSVTGTAFVYPSGAVGYGQIGYPLIWGLVNNTQTPNWQQIVS